MYTISQVGRQVQLSRSTLLYYDRIGLLSASHRSSAGYRLYSESDLTRLERIRTYRATGLSLEHIKALLDKGDADHISTVLEARLTTINREIQALRNQQRQIIDLLGQARHVTQGRVMDKTGWVALLREVGLDDADMHRWHEAFERTMPEAHQDFLESLGLNTLEINQIRAKSRDGF